jgi:hypothetical protein
VVAAGGVGLYARVSSHDHKADLDVLDDGEVDDDLVGDVVEVLTSLRATAVRAPFGTQPGIEGPLAGRSRTSARKLSGPKSTMSGMGDRQGRPVHREIAAPFVVGGPGGARVRTRLRVSDDDVAVLWQVGVWLGGFGRPLPGGALGRRGLCDVTCGA